MCIPLSLIDTLEWKYLCEWKARWWFQMLFIFYPYLGERFNLTKKVSTGLKRPSRKEDKDYIWRLSVGKRMFFGPFLSIGFENFSSLECSERMLHIGPLQYILR